MPVHIDYRYHHSKVGILSIFESKDIIMLVLYTSWLSPSNHKTKTRTPDVHCLVLTIYLTPEPYSVRLVTTLVLEPLLHNQVEAKRREARA